MGLKLLSSNNKELLGENNRKKKQTVKISTLDRSMTVCSVVATTMIIAVNPTFAAMSIASAATPTITPASTSSSRNTSPNSSDKVKPKDPILTCPQDTKLNPDTRMCETDPTPTCPAYAIDSTPNPETNKCQIIVPVICPTGLHWDDNSQQCARFAPLTDNGGCPDPMLNPDPATGQCAQYSAPDGCPQGYEDGPLPGLCQKFVDPIPTCPNITTLNQATGKCEVKPTVTCQPGYVLDANKDKCKKE